MSSPVMYAAQQQTLDRTCHARSALELEAAAALLMLRYQCDLERQMCAASRMAATRPPTPPPPAQTLLLQLASVAADKCTPKEQVRPVVAAAQPLKKRSVPPHLLRRSLTPAKCRPGTGAVGKANRQRSCTKALLKSCRNMIREFLDNQELV